MPHIVTANTETHLLTSPSLQADLCYKLFWLYNLHIVRFIENSYAVG